MQTCMMTVQGESETPLTFSAAAKQLGLSEEAIDHSMSVTLIDPERKLFAVRVFADMITDGPSTKGGPFSDPKIGPFGPC